MSAERTASESICEMTEIVLPEDTNPRGNIFGGRVLALIDKCAAIVAMRHARTRVVTASVDSVDFRNPVRLGEVLILDGRLNAAFGSSMEVEVQVHAEDPLTGVRTLTTTALVTMVSTGTEGGPVCVAPLAITSEDDRRRAEQAADRRRERLQRRRRR